MTARERRMLGTGAAVIGALLLVRLGPAAWNWRTALEEETHARRALASRMRDAIAELPQLEANAGQLQQQLVRLAPRLVEGTTGGTAAAALSLRVGSVADRYRVRVTGEEHLPDSTRAGDVHSVRLRVSMEGDTPGMFGAMAALGTEQPVLEVLALSIEATDPASPRNAPEALRGEMVLRGWYLARDE